MELGKRKPWTPFKMLACLAIISGKTKSAVLCELYSRLNLHLVRANATAILSRCTHIEVNCSQRSYEVWLIQYCALKKVAKEGI